ISLRGAFAKTRPRRFLWRNRSGTWPSSTRFFVRRNRAGGSSQNSNDAVLQGSTLFEAAQIIEKQPDLSFFFRLVSARQMRRDEAVGCVPKRMVRRQRLGLGHIEVRSC